MIRSAPQPGLAGARVTAEVTARRQHGAILHHASAAVSWSTSRIWPRRPLISGIPARNRARTLPKRAS